MSLLSNLCQVAISTLSMDSVFAPASFIDKPAFYLEAAETLNNIASTYQHSGPTSAAILAATKALSASWTQIQDDIMENPEEFTTKLDTTPELRRTINVVESGCDAVFKAMRDENDKFREGQIDDGPLEISLHDKSRQDRYTWDEDAMKILLAQLRQLQTGMNLLLRLLGT
jgi:hypothetical protein